ncbi:MAG: molybdopterin molybdotransferase MoeA [Syntrophomonadaceae bacterium]|nr:molybdopterin molybdotransferase MoeA [Syntrophomonadaceae bacterium]
MERISLTLETAISLCFEDVSEMEKEEITIDQATGRVGARDVFAEINVPSFKRSRVDGYAISSSDMDKIRVKDKVTLEVQEVIPAGWDHQVVMMPGKCLRVMTGAVLPVAAAAVIKQEEIKTLGEQIIIEKPVSDSINIELPGAVINRGERLLFAGQEIYSNQVEKLSSTGLSRVVAYVLPRVYIINTGSELVLPGTPLKNGQIYHSNRSFLLSKVKETGCAAEVGSPDTKDEMDVIIGEIEQGIKSSDMVLISGGTAEGDYDLVISALKHFDARIIFSSLETRPGKNVTAAVIDGKLVFNLPGNPHAAGLLFDVLVRPVLDKLKGIKEPGHNRVNIRLSQDIPRILNIRSLIRAELIEKNAAFFARPLRKKEKYTSIRPIILDIKPGKGKQGDIVKGIIL